MGTSKFAGKKILLMEDDFFVRDIYQRKLKECGFIVEAAADGAGGMDLLRKSVPVPDLVMLDVFMPYKDGRDVLKGIKGDPSWKDIPVILLTNFSASEGVRDGFGLGAEEYLIKSHFTPAEVLKKVESVLEKREKNGILETETSSDGTVQDSPDA